MSITSDTQVGTISYINRSSNYDWKDYGYDLNGYLRIKLCARTVTRKHQSGLGILCERQVKNNEKSTSS